MAEYKLNFKFKENGKSLNELLSEVLKIELGKYLKSSSFLKDNI